VRLFFALWPPVAAARALAEWATKVQRDSGGRATAEETIHLTLAFLGEADKDRALAAARGARGERFELPLETAKYWQHNQIAWAGPNAIPPALEALVASLHGRLREASFVLEKRPFAAHVTLLRKASQPGALPQLPQVVWPVNEFVLVRSKPGSRYEIVERFPLH
jgi:2'-5' RNA ligase